MRDPVYWCRNRRFARAPFVRPIIVQLLSLLCNRKFVLMIKYMLFRCPNVSWTYLKVNKDAIIVFRFLSLVLKFVISWSAKIPVSGIMTPFAQLFIDPGVLWSCNTIQARRSRCPRDIRIVWSSRSVVEELTSFDKAQVWLSQSFSHTIVYPISHEQ